MIFIICFDTVTNTLLSAIGSALGGFIGVMIFFYFRLSKEKEITKPILIAEYLCANEVNQGQENETEGELMHHHGKRISDIEELKFFDANNPIWEWTNDKVGKGGGASIIYGPYVTDFNEPSMYSVTYILRGIDLKKSPRKMEDAILLELDIVSSIPKYSVKDSGEIISFDYYEKSARRYVRINDLAEKGWVSIELKFFSNAKGLWEYRIMPYLGEKDSYTKFKEKNPNARIVFDKIYIKKIPKLQLPLV